MGWLVAAQGESFRLIISNQYIKSLTQFGNISVAGRALSLCFIFWLEYLLPCSILLSYIIIDDIHQNHICGGKQYEAYRSDQRKD